MPLAPCIVAHALFQASYSPSWAAALQTVRQGTRPTCRATEETRAASKAPHPSHWWEPKQRGEKGRTSQKAHNGIQKSGHNQDGPELRPVSSNAFSHGMPTGVPSEMLLPATATLL